MTRKRILGLLVLAMSGTSGTALADWTGKGELGGSFASGNSENEALNATLEVKGTYGAWAHKFGFAGNYGSDGNDTTAQRWELRGQSDYSFTERAYAFGAGRYEDDRFSAYEYQASLAGGLGYKIIDEERTKFWVQGGPGYRFAERRGDCLDDPLPDNLDDCDDRGPSESENSLIFRGDLGFDHQLTETTKVVERFLIETGSDNTYLQNDLGLEVTISGALALRLGYQVRYNSEVQPGTEKTDTLATIGLIYETK
jgi:putative salt-induced outer membrane protein